MWCTISHDRKKWDRFYAFYLMSHVVLQGSDHKLLISIACQHWQRKPKARRCCQLTLETGVKLAPWLMHLSNNMITFNGCISNLIFLPVIARYPKCDDALSVPMMHTCQVTLDISRRPIESYRRYFWEPHRKAMVLLSRATWQADGALIDVGLVNRHQYRR